MKAVGYLKAVNISLDGELTLTFSIENKSDVIKQVEALKDLKLNIDARRHTRKRSMDANGYYWVLCGKLAQKLNTSTTEVYRRHIKDIGNYEVILISDEAIQEFENLWCSNHLGRMIETRSSRFEGFSHVLAYYGSSDFDTKEMTMLIDHIKDDCREFGIDTIPDEEMDRLLKEWGK